MADKTIRNVVEPVPESLIAGKETTCDPTGTITWPDALAHHGCTSAPSDDKASFPHEQRDKVLQR